MGYTSKPINVKENSYSVSITFTNYKAISDFIFEVSERLGYKINLLNDNVLLEREKNFSIVSLDKYDKLRILTKTAGQTLGASIGGPKAMWSTLISKLICNTLKEMSEQEYTKYFKNSLKHFGTSYLEDRLKKLGFLEGVHYTKDMEGRECNIRLDRGLFIVTTLMGSKSDLLLKKILPETEKKEVKGKVNIWTMYINERGKFDILLEKIIKSGSNPNIFLG